MAILSLQYSSNFAEGAEATRSSVTQVAVVGDYVLCGYKTTDRSYELASARMGEWIHVTVDINFFEREGCESFVSDGERLFVASTFPMRQRLNNIHFDRMFCLSIPELCRAQWVNAGPTGQGVEWLLALPSPWGRGTDGPPNRITHTAFCLAAPNKLWMFDARQREEGKKLGDVVVSEMTPVFDVAKKNWGIPKEAVKESIPGLSFTESFHPYHIDGDFFFVTQSGSVYSALKPENEKSRAFVDMKVPFTVRYAVDNGNGTYHLAGTNKEGRWRYAKLGREIVDKPLDTSEGFDKLKPIKAAVHIVQFIKDDKPKK